MSKNPYFAHLPTWRNRQDLAYAIDNLPTILDTLTASSPLLATYLYPSTSRSPSPSSHPSHSSTSAPLAPSPCNSYSSPSAIPPAHSSNQSYSSSSSSSSHATSTTSMSTVAGSPAKSKASAFKERFVLDLAQECHRSLPKSPSPSTTIATTATAASSPSRRVSSGSSSFQNQQQHQQQQYQDYTMNRNTNLYYPLQFSTRARAMEYLIEILQSLQKEPCGCDLVKGCYCGQDGIEDHEGKSPCYVCGEWYPDRCGTGAGTGIGLEGDVDSMKSAQQRQGKSWHEQGSLRHHVAEAKVKKWLDSVWRPPLTPATSPEQENVRQFGLRRSQGDLRYCFDQPHYSSQHHSSQQQQSGYMESGRPWSVYDIEIEARAKSRSRNNSASSSYSLPLVTSPSAFYPLTSSARNLAPYPTPYSSQQDLSGSTQGYGSNSWLWQFTTSPSPSQSSTSKSYFQAPPPSSESYNVPFFGIANKQEYQARARTTSCSDAPLPYNGATPLFAGSSSSLRSSTPPAMRSNSIHTSHMNNIDRTGRSKPVRASTANTTYSIPQEILDPSYRSPTFRIKSWNPNTSSTSSSPLRSAGLQQKEKQNLDTWTPVAKTTFSSSQGESVLKSIKVECSDQEDAMALLLPGANGQQGNTREDPRPTYMGHQTPIRAEVGAELCKVAEVKKSAPFQFNFTSERFRAAVQAKASVDFNNSDHDHNDSNPIKTTTTVQVESTIEHITDGVQKSAALSEAIHHSPSSTMVPTTCVTQVCCLDEKDQVKAVKRTVPIHVETVPEQAESHEELSAKAPSYEYRHESESLNISSKSSLQTSSRLLPIQKSAPMSPSTSQGNDGISPNGESMRTATTKVTTMTSAKAMSHRAHASLNTPGSSSLASTSASTSVSSSIASSSSCSSLSSMCSPVIDPKGPNKNKSSSNNHIERAISRPPLQKPMQIMTSTSIPSPSSLLSTSTTESILTPSTTISTTTMATTATTLSPTVVVAAAAAAAAAATPMSLSRGVSMLLQVDASSLS